MKRFFTLCIALCTLKMGLAQTDSTKQDAPDTIHVGGMVIVREKGSKPAEESRKNKNPHIPHHVDKRSNISTNWWIVDLGFSNYNDRTDIHSAGAQAFAPAYQQNSEWPSLLGGKSRNVNIWIFMQRLNLIQHSLNLKYGAGLELNNYFYDDVRVRYVENPTTIILDPNLQFAKKNKLAADYLTVPVMLNFNFTPNKTNSSYNSFGFSVGVSAGYLYSARQKTKLDGNIAKTHGNFDLDHWKLAYVGEILLGPVKFYGSYAFKSMWTKGLDQTPYTFGFRISTW